MTTRRQLHAALLGAATTALAGCVAGRNPRAEHGSGELETTTKELAMYGIIGQMIAQPGARDELIQILLEGTQNMPGCISYVIARDQGNDNALWITEVWQSKEHHQASLNLESVQAAIARGRPLIEGFGHRFETTPVGGIGT